VGFAEAERNGAPVVDPEPREGDGRPRMRCALVPCPGARRPRPARGLARCNRAKSLRWGNRRGRPHQARECERGRLLGRGPAGALRAPRVPAPPPQAAALDEPAGALAGGGQAADEGDRPVPRRDELPELVLGGARPVQRQRSRTRPHRTGAPATGADARRHDRSDAGLTDRIGCGRLRGCAVNSSVARTRPDRVPRRGTAPGWSWGPKPRVRAILWTVGRPYASPIPARVLARAGVGAGGGAVPSPLPSPLPRPEGQGDAGAGAGRPATW
jgi:hypothetical protein